MDADPGGVDLRSRPQERYGGRGVPGLRTAGTVLRQRTLGAVNAAFPDAITLRVELERELQVEVAG